MVRQDAVFQRPEHRGLHAQAEQYRQQTGNAVGQKSVGGSGHQQDLGRLCHLDQAGFVETIGELPGGRGQQDVGCDEQRTGQRREARSARTQFEYGQDDHCVFDEIVVERPARLRQTQRPKPPGRQQRHGFPF